MSKQRTLVALDWLIPVLQDVFAELRQLLEQEPVAWSTVIEQLHQVHGALTLTNQPLLAQLASRLEQLARAIEDGTVATSHRGDVMQGVTLLQHEAQQLQRTQRFHRPWVVERLNVLNALLGEPPLSEAEIFSDEDAPVSQDELSLLSQLPVPAVNDGLSFEQYQQLVTVWRYNTLQLLKQQRNDPQALQQLAKVANYLAASPLDVAYRQVWQLVALWCDSLALNDIPTPSHYGTLLSQLDGWLSPTLTVPNATVAQVAVDVLLQLNELVNKTLPAQTLLTTLDFNDNPQHDTLFSQTLAKLEKIIFQVNEPKAIYAPLMAIKDRLANRGWVVYEHELAQVLADLQMMIEDDSMVGMLSWQVERQLQDIYSQLLETADTLESQIGFAHFAYATDPQQEAVRRTRLHLENIKLAFNSYSQSHELTALEVNDDFVSMIQVFGMLGLTRPKELIEQLRLLFGRLSKQQIQRLSWEATDAIAEMIARLELFLDYLSHQSVSEELLDQTQIQLNRANLLVNQSAEKVLQQPTSRDKVFEANTLVYDDEGEKRISTETVSDAEVADTDTVIDETMLDSTQVPEADSTQPAIAAPTIEPQAASDDSDSEGVPNTEATASVAAPHADVAASEALLAARAALKPDDYSVDEEIREIFIEEADEVLAQMDSDLPSWQADPTDLATLKEIRRGFHTLKGSGRMVGAFQVGEMAWAVENMLNRVLDGTLPVTDTLVKFIADTRQRIPTLVADYAAQREPSIDPAITVLQANNLLAHLPIDTGLPTTATAAAPALTESEPVPVAEQQADNEVSADSPVASDVPVFSDTTDTVQAAAVLPEAVQVAYDQLPEVQDEPADPDIQEIYVEEAQEVLETITPLYANWQADTSDTATLKDIRRGFHTLKGSGRMVGALQLGELAWSIENMLNRVLDNTIEASEGLVALVGDVIAKFPELITMFAEHRSDYPDIIKVWSAVANAYAKKQGDTFDYAALMSASQSGVKATDSTQAITSQPTTQTEPATAAELSTAQPVMSEAIDTESSTDTNADTPNAGQLLADDDSTAEPDKVFIEEANEILATIEGFIAEHRNDDHTLISDTLVRAFHTLRGGAAISHLPRVCALSAALEESLNELLRKEIPLTQDQLSLIATVKDDLRQYLQDYADTESIDAQPDDGDEIDEIKSQLLAHVEGLDEAPQVGVQSYIDLGIDDLLDAGDVLEQKLADDEAVVVAYASVLAAQASKLADATAEMSYVAIADTLRFSYDILVQYPAFAKDPQVIEQLLALHNQLITMFDAIAAGLNVVVHQDSLQQLRQLFSDKIYQAQLDAIKYETVQTDFELLQIFLEEAQELHKTAQETYLQWQNNLSNAPVLTELQRLFHTLKGGANIVGIPSIANIARVTEQVYAALASGKLESDPEIAIILQKVNEIIGVQLQYINEQHRSFYADQFTEQLQAILAGEVRVADVVPDVPLIVELGQGDTDRSVDDSHKDTAGADRTADPLYIQETINNFEQRRLETWQGTEPDQDILGIFLEEAKELIESSSQHLQEFRSNTNNVAALQALQRELHTIKGGARMVGAEGLANLAHEMETIYEELGARRKPSTRMIGNLLAACHDWLASSLYVLENRYNPQTPTPLIKALQDFSKNPDSLKELPTASLAAQIEQIEIYQSSLAMDAEDKQTRDLSVIPAMSGNFEHEQEQSNLNAEMLRISAGLMERMINLSGESAINRARIEMGISSLTNTIEEMGSTVQRLADQLRRMETELEIQILAQIGEEHGLDSEFDPLEMDQYSALNQLSKSLSESASDLIDIKTTMLDKTRDTENLLLQLSRTQTELQEGLMNSRTVPFSRITPRLQRIVRQTATELGKSVELRIINDEGEIDRNILERITSPLEHMLRNAVDHGIEKSQERIESGKPRIGLITLDIQREGGEIVINLTDDGKGINVEAVRNKAIQQGLISADDTSLKPLDIMQYIFNAGLSTSASVTQISGRGVGMDVVQNQVKQLGGAVLVDSEQGKGSRFTMRLPLTVAVSDALVVRAADKYFAVPLVQIERVVRVNTETIYQFHTLEANTLDIDGQDYRLRYLNQILYNSDPIEALRQQSISVPVIIIRTEAGQRMALQVDAIAGSRIEVVVKPLGRQLSHIAGISAATIMGDGSVMLILDLIALMRNASTAAKVDARKAAKAAIKDDRKPVVLIIDDSVTVRKVTSRLLERNGYEAQIATDGVDAIEKLQDLTPDLMLLDIEMPRMDGFEVANQVRHNDRLKDVPIIMITSRTGEKHRERAMTIGVNAYMGKPFQEQTLLTAIQQLISGQSVE